MGQERNLKYLETNKNRNKAYQNLWDIEKNTSEREVYSVCMPIFKKKERSKTYNLRLQGIRKTNQDQS